MCSGEVTVDTEISEGNRLKNEVIRSTLVYDGPTNEKRADYNITSLQFYLATGFPDQWPCCKVVVREPAFTDSGLIGMGCHSLSSPPSPSSALNRDGHPFPAGRTEGVFENSRSQAVSKSVCFSDISSRWDCPQGQPCNRGLTTNP